MARKGQGRRKISIQKIENEARRSSTFSKRRSGIFKKASELSILCECEVAIVFFGMMEKMYTFGEPSATSIFNRFIKESPWQDNTLQQILRRYRENIICAQNADMAEIHDIIKNEKGRGKAMDEKQKYSDDQNYNKFWWLEPIENSTLDQAQVMLEKVEKFERNLYKDPLEHSPDSSVKENNNVSSRIADVENVEGDVRVFDSRGNVGARDKGKAPMWE